MSDARELRERAQGHRATTLRLLGPIPTVRGYRGGRAAHDASVIAALRTGPPEATASWRAAEATWWELAQLGTQRMVVAEAHRLHVAVSTRYELADLTQAGWEGAYRAAQTWDPEAGAGWRTYARAGIRARIQVQLRIGQTEVVQAPSRLRAQSWRLTRELAALGDRPDALAVAAERTGLSMLEVASLRATRTPLYLDAPISDDGIGHDVIPAPARDDDRAELLGRLGAAIASLPEQQRVTIIGILSEEPYHQIGRRLGVCRERIRQIYVSAVRSLRIALDVERPAEEPVRLQHETLPERIARALRGRALTVGELTQITGAEWGQVYRAARRVAEVGPGRRWSLRAP